METHNILIDTITSDIKKIENICISLILKLGDSNFSKYLSDFSDDCNTFLSETKILAKACNVEIGKSDCKLGILCNKNLNNQQEIIKLFLQINLSFANLLCEIKKETKTQTENENQILELANKITKFYEKNIETIKLYLCN